MTASILLLNWKRPANLTRILATEAAYRKVAELIVLNNNAAAPFHYSHPRVKILNASTDFGLRARWILAALAKSECLVFQDDDILLPESTVAGFIAAVASDKRCAYSLHGRNPGPRDVYSADVAVGEVEIVLTRAAAIHSELVPVILHAEHAFHAAGYKLPVNNGEDIFLSYCISARFGRKHKVLRLPFADLPSPYALSARLDHMKERTRLLRQCKKFFSKPRH